ncbi:MAG: hypothetical protein HY774_20785 [Acidobacteria bacterium]|nr:hypothetical protein [Acidobacteriota bacterium]
MNPGSMYQSTSGGFSGMGTGQIRTVADCFTITHISTLYPLSFQPATIQLLLIDHQTSGRAVPLAFIRDHKEWFRPGSNPFQSASLDFEVQYKL